MLMALISAALAASENFLVEELHVPSAPLPPGVTAPSECVVTLALPDLGDARGAGAAAAAAARAEGAWTADPVRSGRDAGAPFEVWGVTACEDPYLSAAKAWLDGRPADARATQLFGGQVFDVRVVFAPTTIARRPTRGEPRLDEAVEVAEAPEKYFDKPANRPRDMKPGRCTIGVWIDAKGAPYGIDQDACRDDLRLVVEMTAFEWRYTPYEVDGKAVPAKFTTEIVVK